jgi:hypothetical protein
MRLITRARRDAALVGVGVGTVAVIAATVLAVVGLTPHKPAPAVPHRSHDTDARLRTALLEAQDLPASFAPRPVAVPAVTPARRPEKCSRLVADPVTVLRWLHPKESGPAVTSARHTGADHGVLDQAVRVFDRGEAATAIATLRKTAQSCTAFTARLDDGTKAQVKVVRTAGDDLLIGDSYTVSMTLHTPVGQRDTYLAVGRVGDVVSVLRRTAPTGSDQAALDAQIKDLVGKAVSKIVDLGGGLSGLVATPGAK